MLIKVYRSLYRDGSILNNDNMLKLAEGKTLREVMIKLKVLFYLHPMPFVLVNHEKPTLTQVLNDGDTISFGR